MTAHFLLHRVTPSAPTLSALLAGGTAVTAHTAPTALTAAGDGNTIWD
ncbi:hypothetical protein ACWCXX_33190 [Streptomyces sp. NPDC001732]